MRSSITLRGAAAQAFFDSACAASEGRTSEPALFEAHPYRRTNGLELGPPVTLEQAKAAHVARVLDELAWNLTEAALVLAVDRRTMHRLVKRYGLSRPARVFSRAT